MNVRRNSVVATVFVFMPVVTGIRYRLVTVDLSVDWQDGLSGSG